MRQERCPYCNQWIFVVEGKFCRHKPHRGHKDGPNCIGSGDVPDSRQPRDSIDALRYTVGHTRKDNR